MNTSQNLLTIAITSKSTISTTERTKIKRNTFLSASSAGSSTERTPNTTSSIPSSRPAPSTSSTRVHGVPTSTSTISSTHVYSHRTRSNEEVCFHLKFTLPTISIILLLSPRSTHIHRRHRNSLCHRTKPLSRRLRRRYQSRLCKYRRWRQRSAHHEFNGRNSKSKSCVPKTRGREGLYCKF